MAPVPAGAQHFRDGAAKKGTFGGGGGNGVVGKAQGAGGEGVR